MVTSTYSFLGHASGQSAIKVLSVSSRVDPRGSMNGEIQGISRVCVFVNPFTCHLLCSEGNNGVGVGLGVCRFWGVGICRRQEMFTLLARRAQWMLSTRAGGRSLTDTQPPQLMTWHQDQNEAGSRKIDGRI